jgi:hypothetical protein
MAFTVQPWMWVIVVVIVLYVLGWLLIQYVFAPSGGGGGNSSSAQGTNQVACKTDQDCSSSNFRCDPTLQKCVPLDPCPIGMCTKDCAGPNGDPNNLTPYGHSGPCPCWFTTYQDSNNQTQKTYKCITTTTEDVEQRVQRLAAGPYQRDAEVFAYVFPPSQGAVRLSDLASLPAPWQNSSSNGGAGPTALLYMLANRDQSVESFYLGAAWCQFLVYHDNYSGLYKTGYPWNSPTIAGACIQGWNDGNANVQPGDQISGVIVSDFKPPPGTTGVLPFYSGTEGPSIWYQPRNPAAAPATNFGLVHRAQLSYGGYYPSSNGTANIVQQGVVQLGFPPVNGQAFCQTRGTSSSSTPPSTTTSTTTLSASTIPSVGSAATPTPKQSPRINSSGLVASPTEPTAYRCDLALSQCPGATNCCCNPTSCPPGISTPCPNHLGQVNNGDDRFWYGISSSTGFSYSPSRYAFS